ncbi:hypothetical protein FCK90_02315 [Kocuria coralli]|uniref:Hydrolase n=1 Tax=Kocuria coralli TaxID=1461025 RepID=A0A5J5KZZ5_9MICC|nr:DUF6882 domain-containing protein [Kocuria coralli]KAA9395264.1 hypothetical protein FCK90_02315 [Kocuria coralli]
MTTSLQELIDDSIFISTEHQARLAELSQGVEWDVDFSVPSFTLQSDPPVVLTPHLLGTDSEQRGSWVWSWQELGHFPSEVVAAAVQSRESGARADVPELITDELPTRDGLARQLTLASKALTGVWAHYPARVGKQVTAWLLLEGPELELAPISVGAMMQVIAEALQTGTAVDHNRALDSYARLRGLHIEWDTDATCVVTTRDGAMRFWFEDHQISGVEPAESAVSEADLTRLEQDARTRREALGADRADARRIADEQAVRDTTARAEEESARREATAAAVSSGSPVDDSQEPLPAELSREDLEAPVPGSAEAGEDLPYDQEPRRDVAPGEVTTTTVPSLAEERDAEGVAEDRNAQPDTEPSEVLEGTDGFSDETADREAPAAESPETIAADEEPGSDGEAAEVQPEVVQPRVEEPAVARPVGEEAVEPVERAEDEAEPAPAEDEPREQDERPRKKGFFSRFFGV